MTPVEWSPKATRKGFNVLCVRAKNLKNGRFYPGSTDNMDRRLNEHNSGGSKYTRSTKPFRLVYTEEFETRSEACKREVFFKSGKGRELLKTLIKMRA